MGSRSAETDAEPTAKTAGSADQPGPELSARQAGGTNAPAAAAEPSTASHQVSVDQRPDIEFNIAVDIIYNRARQAFLLRLHRLAMFASIIGGAVAMSDLTGPRIPALVAASAAALDLVCDFVGRAASHGDAVRELIGVIADLQAAEFSEPARANATDKWIRMGAAMPATHHVARDLAFNQTIIAFGRDESYWVPVSLWRRLTANWLRYEGTKPAQTPSPR